MFTMQRQHLSLDFHISFELLSEVHQPRKRQWEYERKAIQFVGLLLISLSRVVNSILHESFKWCSEVLSALHLKNGFGPPSVRRNTMRSFFTEVA